MMLTHLLLKLTVRQAHWVQNKLKITDGFHDWLHGWCPCSVGDMNEEDDDAVA